MFNIYINRDISSVQFKFRILRSETGGQVLATIHQQVIGQRSSLHTQPIMLRWSNGVVKWLTQGQVESTRPPRWARVTLLKMGSENLATFGTQRSSIPIIASALSGIFHLLLKTLIVTTSRPLITVTGEHIFTMGGLGIIHSVLENSIQGCMLPLRYKFLLSYSLFDLINIENVLLLLMFMLFHIFLKLDQCRCHVILK